MPRSVWLPFALVLASALAACSNPTSVQTPPTLSQLVAEDASLTSFAALAAAVDLDLDDPWLIGERARYTLYAPSNGALDAYAATFLGAGNRAENLLALIGTLDPASDGVVLFRLFVVAHFVPGIQGSELFRTPPPDYGFDLDWYEYLDDDCSYTSHGMVAFTEGDDASVELYFSGWHCGTVVGSLYIDLGETTFRDVDLAFDRGIVHVIDTFTGGGWGFPF